MHVHITRTLLVLAVAASGCRSAPTPTSAPPRNQLRDIADSVNSTADVLYHARCIYLPMRINDGDERLFLLDTGASASAIDSTVAADLGLPPGEPTEVEGTAGVITVGTALIDKLACGDAAATDLLVTTQDLGGLLAPPGRTVAGIVGYDFLRSFRLRVDYENLQIELTSGGPSLADSTAVELEIPFTLDNGIPRIEGRLNGSVNAAFRLDTGASIFETEDVYINITEEVWEALVAATPGLEPETYFSATGVGGELRLAVARIDELSCGPVTVERPFVIVQPRAGYFARDDAVGFVSNNLLEKYSPVTIDYVDPTIRLTPPTRARE